MTRTQLYSINERFIKSLKPPQSAIHKIYWDDKITGFGVRITKNGFISFILRYVIQGKERKYTIGNYPALSSSAAKEMAITLKGDIARNIDPLTQKNEFHKFISIEDLSIKYIQYAEKLIRPNTFIMYKTLITNYIIPQFGKYKVNTIKNTEIEAFHLTLKNKLHTANRVLTLLSIIFQYAIKHNIIENSPTKGIKKFYEEKRERYLSNEEIQSIMGVLAKSANQMNVKAIKLLLLTGSRKGEILKAKWCQFDFSRGLWLKPASFTKQKKPSIVVLNTYTIEILQEMKQNIVKSDDISLHVNEIISTEEYLFYNTQTKKELNDIKRFFAKICMEANIKNLRIHDLRHTFASILVSNDVSLEKTGALIGHSNTSTTQRYAHLSSKSLFNASEVAGDIIRSLGDVSQ